MGTLLFALGFLGSLGGCATQPVFFEISEISLTTQNSNGSHKQVLEGDQLAEAVWCLEGGTVEVSPEELSSDVLQEILMVGVKDRNGDRMFELTSTQNFSGNKGKLYRNECIYRIVKGK